jgi:hypothetical protein
MKLPKVSVGNLVEIRFWDHHENLDEPVEYFVYGRVAKVTRLAITVHTWATIDGKPVDEDNRHNIHMFTIVRSAITEINFLHRFGE